MSVSAVIPVITKDPSAFLPYGFDLSLPSISRGEPYLAEGETVIELTVQADTGITVVSSGIHNNSSNVATQVVAWISGGTLNGLYNVHFFFTTSLGNQDTRSLTLRIVQK